MSAPLAKQATDDLDIKHTMETGNDHERTQTSGRKMRDRCRDRTSARDCPCLIYGDKCSLRWGLVVTRPTECVCSSLLLCESKV